EHCSQTAPIAQWLQAHLPNDTVDRITETSDRLYMALSDLTYPGLRDPEIKILDFIRLQSVSHNITQVAINLQREQKTGFSVSNVWRIVDRLATDRFIETVGGKGSGKRDRFCFANVATLESRRIRDEKEEIIDGTVSSSILPYLDFNRAFTFDINVYEFNSKIQPNIYVISPCDFRIGYRVRTIGKFFEGGLEEQLKNRFGISFRKRREQYYDEDALLAYVHLVGEEVIWYDEENTRARAFT
ncbi:MAG: hypothetical protein KAW09_11610, partial [Thermoplasmata archaeon]|nr:hypothetical protein [Thermoplasmata archaeon]